MKSMGSTFGTYPGDISGIWGSTNITDNDSDYIVEGTLSYHGTISPFSKVLKKPEPADMDTYIRIQVNSVGEVELLTSSEDYPELNGEIMLFEDIIPKAVAEAPTAPTA